MHQEIDRREHGIEMEVSRRKRRRRKLVEGVVEVLSFGRMKEWERLPVVEAYSERVVKRLD